MSALHDTTTTSTQAERLANNWALGFVGVASPGFRRMLSPWALQHMRGLAAVHFTSAVLLLGVFVALVALGHDAWATLPLLGAVLHFSIGRADLTVARSVSPRA
jgi:hypothetical protein